ncbi:MAG TPA: response regulator [Anaerolineales bacterium]
MSTPPKTVMIIEDEPDAAEVFDEMMQLSGYRVLKTYSSTAALTLISQEKPSIVLLDIMMPDVSGLEVLRYVRSDPELASIPVVVVSAKATPEDIRLGLDAGASAYLTKPVGYVDLKAAVDRLVQAQ